MLRLLGSIEDQRVVELGAGIGRFTGELAGSSKSVLALDFMENLIEENKVINSHFGNIDFRCGDVTELTLPEGSADIVFSNWLLMYLNDIEVANLAASMLSWVSEGGFVFFRESCFRQSGDKSRKNNPTHYRNPREYFRIFDAVRHVQPDGKVAHLELVLCKSIDTYVRVKQNQNQICWKWRKVVSDAAHANDRRHFLDGQQYTLAGISRYARMFGNGFISPGGAETAKEFTEFLKLKPEDSVLDVGCGLGGPAVYIARAYHCYVYGIDLSVNMILTALERAAAHGNGDLVSFEISDAMKREFPPETFDAVHSRDSLLHISDKKTLFAKLYSVLKPGGRLLITDYCRGPDDISEGFAAYIKKKDYDLHTITDYAELLKQAGFVDVKAKDCTEQFKQCLTKELEAAVSNRQSFVEELSAEDYNITVKSWEEKLERAVNGEQKWGLFTAMKPAVNGFS